MIITRVNRDLNVDLSTIPKPLNRAEAKAVAQQLQAKFYQLFSPQIRGNYDFRPFQRLITIGALGKKSDPRPIQPEVISHLLDLLAADQFARQLLFQASKVRRWWGLLVYQTWLKATHSDGISKFEAGDQARRWQSVDDWQKLNGHPRLASYESDLMTAEAADLLRSNRPLSTSLKPIGQGQALTARQEAEFLAQERRIDPDRRPDGKPAAIGDLLACRQH